MSIILAVLGIIAVAVLIIQYENKVIYPEGTWFEYTGEAHPCFFSSPLIRLLQDYTEGDRGNNFPWVSHAELDEKGKVVQSGLLGLHNYQKVSDLATIKKLENAYLKKIKAQKQELDFNKKKEQEHAMKQFLA